MTELQQFPETAYYAWCNYVACIINRVRYVWLTAVNY